MVYTHALRACHFGDKGSSPFSGTKDEKARRAAAVPEGEVPSQAHFDKFSAGWADKVFDEKRRKYGSE